MELEGSWCIREDFICVGHPLDIPQVPKGGGSEPSRVLLAEPVREGDRAMGKSDKESHFLLSK